MVWLIRSNTEKEIILSNILLHRMKSLIRGLSSDVSNATQHLEEEEEEG